MAATNDNATRTTNLVAVAMTIMNLMMDPVQGMAVIMDPVQEMAMNTTNTTIMAPMTHPMTNLAEGLP